MLENRAKLEKHFQELRTSLSGLVQTLEKPNFEWYGSILLERRFVRKFNVNHKSRVGAEEVREGAVLRIYDGYTLFESATDEVSLSNLESKAEDLVERVKSSTSNNGSPKYYDVPNWKQRLEGQFEKEILSQIPENPTPSTNVHFGTNSIKQLWLKNSGAMDFAIKCLSDLQTFASQLPADHKCRQPDFFQVGLDLGKEDYVFVDREVNLSQTLLRNRLLMMVVKGEERGYEVLGGLGGIESVDYNEEQIGDIFDSAQKAIVAEKMKPGRFKVLMGPDVTGVFAHEAFGHAQEGDTCARGRSKAWELFHTKQPVGNEHATILNNPAIFKNAEFPYGAWGSYYFDEEGWLAQEQFLVKEGVLQAPMTNLTSAIRLNIPRTANGKRECWSHGVYTRQTNTYFSAGEYTFDEMIKAIDYGFLAVHAAGGMEDPKGMGIQVGIAYLEEIKDGKLTGKVFKGPGGGSVQMTGYTPDYLNSILMKSKVEAFDSSKDEAQFPQNKVGGCGKYHKELVLAGCGGPYLLVENVLLG